MCCHASGELACAARAICSMNDGVPTIMLDVVTHIRTHSYVGRDSFICDVTRVESLCLVVMRQLVATRHMDM